MSRRGLLWALGPTAALLAGCVVAPAHVALSLGSSVASRLIVDNYIEPTFMRAGAGTSNDEDSKARSIDGAWSRDFHTCIEQYRDVSGASAQLAHLRWCQSLEITHEERTRLLVAEASVALSAGDTKRFREAAARLGPGVLLAVHQEQTVDMVGVVKGLASGRANNAMPPALGKMLLAASPPSTSSTEGTPP